MIRSRVFVVLAIALFLTSCLFAEETAAPAALEAPADINKAKNAVTELQELTAKVLGDAETKSSEADRVKTNVNDQKRKADSAESAVRTAAQTITADRRKTEADAVVKTAESELAKCIQLYKDANKKAETASVSLKEFVARARTLDNDAKTKIVPASGQQNDYAQVIQSAAAAKTQTTTLNGEIETSKDLSAAQTAFFALRDGAKNVQMLKYQAESIAIVSRIEIMLNTAETNIQSIEEKKEEIDAIVKDMNTKCEGASEKLTSVLSALCNNAESQLGTATKKVKEAQQCSTVMQQRKTQVDTAFEGVKAAADESNGGQEVETLVLHEKFFADELQKIKAALGAAEIASNSATGAQKQMEDELSKHNSQSGTKINERNPQDNVRTAEVTKTSQNGEAQNPAITETDQTALGKSKDKIDKTSEPPDNAIVETTEQTKSTQLTDNEKQNPKDDKSELLNKDKLRNITKDMTNNPLIGGEVPTRSAANDSAVTVLIPLLVILVISAVLH